MSEMTPFWQGWIIVLSVGNLLACLWLIWWASKKRAGDPESGDVMPHIWDGNLQEKNNPLPRWWLWLFYGTLIFGAVYYTLYPGLWNGVLQWTSADKSMNKTVTEGNKSQYETEMEVADGRYGPIYAKYRAMAIPDLMKDSEANDMGKRLYLTYCMQCHGSDAKGGHGFPNLTDKDWLWGGDADKIVASITSGRNAAMPAHGPSGSNIGADKIDQVANYVYSLNGRAPKDAAKAELGKAVFQSAGCFACHGPEAKGNPIMGAPNLTDKTWLYGGSLGIITKTITNGRNGVMPAHKNLLGEDKIHVLAGYIYSLSNK